MDVSEFRKLGYLQELNRQFLHPLGLALSITVDDNGSESFGQIMDCRNDPEGIFFDLEKSSQERKNQFAEKAEFVQNEKQRIANSRTTKLGFVIEPI